MCVTAVMYQQGEILQKRRHACIVKFDLDCVFGFDKAESKHLDERPSLASFKPLICLT